ncbi:putative pectinesterase 68 [Glycine soja]
MAPLFISMQMLLQVFSCILFHATTTTVTCTTYHHSTPKIVSSKNSSNWVEPIGHQVITVDAKGGGHFRSVQAAANAVPVNNRKGHPYSNKPWILHVVVPVTKPYIMFHGAGRDVTVIEWHDRASDPGPNRQQLHTYRTASVTNTAPAPMPGMEGWQAVAFRISGDKAYFSGCGFYGAQDTLCNDAGRHYYFKECYIEGSIDFIFGNGRSMYKDCVLWSVQMPGTRSSGYTWSPIGPRTRFRICPSIPGPRVLSMEDIGLHLLMLS